MQPPIEAHDELKAWNVAPAHHSVLLDQPPLKTLEFRKKVFNSDLYVWNKTHEVQVFFAACSVWPKRPDVTLHQVMVGQVIGQDVAPGPIIGVAHFRYSKHIRFGLGGDPKAEPNKVVWEEMQNVSKKFKKNRYEWEFTEHADWNGIEAGNPPPSPRLFMWQRTVDPADGVETGKMSLRNYRLIDQKTGAVVAVFVASTVGMVRKRGELRIFEVLRPKLEMAVVLTCASISEKLHRD